MISYSMSGGRAGLGRRGGGGEEERVVSVWSARAARRREPTKKKKKTLGDESSFPPPPLLGQPRAVPLAKMSGESAGPRNGWLRNGGQGMVGRWGESVRKIII